VTLCPAGSVIKTTVRFRRQTKDRSESVRHLRRVVVTGLGAVTPLGHCVSDFWDGLIHNRRAIDRITRFDPTGLRNEKGGEVRDWSFVAPEFGLAQAPDLATQFLLCAAREAVTDAQSTPPTPDPARMGAVLSTNFGGSPSWEEFVESWLAGHPCPESFEEFAFDTALDHVFSCFGLAGPGSVLSIACASGAAAVGSAFDLIRYGRADLMLCGGHDALARSPLAGLSVLRTISPNDILPFSANRSGTLFGEGAAILVLESLDHAAARGASAYCEVMGSWQNNNAYHLTAPDPGGNGMIRVLTEALADGGVDPAEVDYINAHGTGTEYHDPEETHAIKTVLGAHAYDIAVSSIKGAIGHLMGAAGAAEAVATVKTIQTGIAPPTMNDGVADPEMDLDFVVNHSRPHPTSCAATISAGVGGSNACVVFRALEDPPEGLQVRGPHADPCAGGEAQ
jgi:3-oxoacyl-[acyl-carrier-protein] synthase II